ncbi:hypothetical protein FHT39_001246 [Mitsuaria sp. BK045]|uniref:hypothetical protein n=1 Tax=unclassified Roseateles TaxID=2626991 RepID=UPI001616A95D|nr:MULTISPECIES: hypothetical protein [unclassified Roseateles]MBB3292607.1 hypothetical protein [Mitsuaria sp. BK041]MBB3361824.1 hypothetical protein [Mitsuaria sp. BK045]
MTMNEQLARARSVVANLPQEVADTLNDAVRSRWIDLDLCRDGFLFSFIGQEDEGALAEGPEVAGDGVHEGAIHGHHHA